MGWITILVLPTGILAAVSIIAITLVPMTALSFGNAPSPILQFQAAKSQGWGANLGAFHDAARRYAAANSGVTGTVTAATISGSLPPGYVALGPWAALLTATSVTSYANGALPASISSGQVAVGLARYAQFRGYAGYIDGTGAIRVPIGEAAPLDANYFHSTGTFPTTANPVAGLAQGTPIWTSTR